MAVTLIIEDGTIVANANSYVTLAEATAYHESMGNDTWVTSPDEEADVAIIRGTAYVDRRYAGKWPGVKTGERDQSLQWPREGGYDKEGWEIEDNEIPKELKQAVYEAALRELVNPGSLSPDVVQTDRVLREKVDVLEVQYADVSDPAGTVPIITAIDEILAPILGAKSNSSVSFVQRA
jgi:hypothetical protein